MTSGKFIFEINMNVVRMWSDRFRGGIEKSALCLTINVAFFIIMV